MRRFFGKLYVQVLIGVFAGVALGFFNPGLGVDVKPLGDVFIKLIKMVFAPIIFAMVVLGIARMENMKELGRVGARALIYFEVLSTFALGLGLLAVNLVGPGVGMNVDPAALDTKAIANYTATSAKPAGFVDFLLNMVPTSIVDALAKNDILQILVFAILFGVALSHIGPRAKPVIAVLDSFIDGIFAVVGMIMRLAPIAAFGAMSFTVGKYGLASIVSLGKLMGTMYITCALFVVVVLGFISWLSGFSLWKFLKYIKDEIFTVLGTSSSESVGRHVQSRRPMHLLHDGGDLHCPGHEHAADLHRPTRGARRADDHLQGFCGRHRFRLHHARRDAGFDGQYSGRGHGPAAWRGPLHVGGTRHHQHHRQCRRHRGDRTLGRIGRPGTPGASSGRQDGSGGSSRAVRSSGRRRQRHADRVCPRRGLIAREPS